MGCREGRGGQQGDSIWEDFGKEIGGVDKAGKEDKTEKMLACPLLEPV